MTPGLQMKRPCDKMLACQRRRSQEAECRDTHVRHQGRSFPTARFHRMKWVITHLRASSVRSQCYGDWLGKCPGWDAHGTPLAGLAILWIWRRWKKPPLLHFLSNVNDEMAISPDTRLPIFSDLYGGQLWNVIWLQAWALEPGSLGLNAEFSSHETLGKLPIPPRMDSPPRKMGTPRLSSS